MEASIACARRAFFPCLLLILTVLSVLHFLDVPGAKMYSDPDRATLGHSLFAALTFHMNWLEGQHGWSPPAWGILWSLSIEEVFYLGVPAGMPLYSK